MLKNHIHIELPEPEPVTLESLTKRYRGRHATRQCIAEFRADKARLSDEDRKSIEQLFGVE